MSTPLRIKYPDGVGALTGAVVFHVRGSLALAGNV